jgi:hypothetical protein
MAPPADLKPSSGAGDTAVAAMMRWSIGLLVVAVRRIRND